MGVRFGYYDTTGSEGGPWTEGDVLSLHFAGEGGFEPESMRELAPGAELLFVTDEPDLSLEGMLEYPEAGFEKGEKLFEALCKVPVVGGRVTACEEDWVEFRVTSVENFRDLYKRTTGGLEGAATAPDEMWEQASAQQGWWASGEFPVWLLHSEQGRAVRLGPNTPSSCYITAR